MDVWNKEKNNGNRHQANKLISTTPTHLASRNIRLWCPFSLRLYMDERWKRTITYLGAKTFWRAFVFSRCCDTTVWYGTIKMTAGNILRNITSHQTWYHISNSDTTKREQVLMCLQQYHLFGSERTWKIIKDSDPKPHVSPTKPMSVRQVANVWYPETVQTLHSQILNVLTQFEVSELLLWKPPKYF